MAVRVTLIDRQNYHLFQPLLYQVATGGLSPANIASPLRGILERQQNCRVLQAEVTGFDLRQQRVLLSQGAEPYDYLIVAAGATHSYFGNDHWRPLAPGLKTLNDATRIRAQVLSAFERAERSTDAEQRRRLLTFMVVGGGPTGVELSGALSELAHHTLRGEFRQINPADARILLVDASPSVLSSYPEDLRKKAAGYLDRLQVEVHPRTMVTAIAPGEVTLATGDAEQVVHAETVLWAAGVKASPLAAKLAEAAGLETDRVGRVPVGEDLTLPGWPQVYAIGDMALAKSPQGHPYPGLAPVAIQQGQHAVKQIWRQAQGQSTQGFKYQDYGSMATVGRNAAVVDMGRIRFAGYFAWLTWLFVHLMQLVGFESRLLVLFQWAWNYVTRNRSARLINDPSFADTRAGPGD